MDQKKYIVEKQFQSKINDLICDFLFNTENQQQISFLNLLQNKSVWLVFINRHQRWSPRGSRWPRGRPRGHILKSLSLASRPQVLENWPALGSRTAVFFELLKFCGALEKFLGKRFFVEIA